MVFTGNIGVSGFAYTDSLMVDGAVASAYFQCTVFIRCVFDLPLPLYTIIGSTRLQRDSMLPDSGGKDQRGGPILGVETLWTGMARSFGPWRAQAPAMQIERRSPSRAIRRMLSVGLEVDNGNPE